MTVSPPVPGVAARYDLRGKLMKRRHVTLLLIVFCAGLVQQAAAASPMSALQYYVGTWSCSEHEAGTPPLSSRFTFAMDSNLLREWIGA
jgi:hypothetical protein